MKQWFLVVVLLALVVTSAVAVVGAKHEARQLFIALERAGKDQDEHRVEWSRLQLELAFHGESRRIEQHARDEIGMRQPSQFGLLVRDDG